MYSSIAQSVEQTAVNRWVVGSSPTRGVFYCQEIKGTCDYKTKKRRHLCLRFFAIHLYICFSPKDKISGLIYR